MNKLEKWQVKHTDALRLKLSHPRRVNQQWINQLIGTDYAILEGRSGKTTTTVYISKVAKLNFHNDAPIQFI